MNNLSILNDTRHRPATIGETFPVLIVAAVETLGLMATWSFVLAIATRFRTIRLPHAMVILALGCALTCIAFVTGVTDFVATTGFSVPGTIHNAGASLLALWWAKVVADRLAGSQQHQNRRHEGDVNRAHDMNSF
jgi:hypothetical protein